MIIFNYQTAQLIYSDFLSSQVFKNTSLPLFHTFLSSSLTLFACLSRISHTLSYKAHTHTQKYFHLADYHKQSQTHTHTHPPQHQRESVMSVVEGVDTALSTNMLISYATETFHLSAVLEMGHNTATTKTHT